MLGGRVEETILSFPVITLKKVYQLRYGAIGPASKLLRSYHTLSKILPAFEKITVDGKKIEDPVFAASTLDYEKFIGEIEALAFLTAKDRECRAAEEIFGHKIMFTVHKKNGKDSICIDGCVLFSPENLLSVQLQDFPRGFYRWDMEKILEFEVFLEKTLKEGLYKAIVSCLSDVGDKETERERTRIIISLTLFNQAFIHLSLTQPFSHTQVILVAAAFEALLNLPSDAIGASFQHAVTTLVGPKTSLLKRWCKEFYDYRSALVHGNVVWGGEEKTFNPSGKEGPVHSVIARHLFVSCLKKKLFLMGLFSGYIREEFDFYDFVTSW